MRREGSYPPKRHAASGIVAVLHGVVVVPLRLSPRRERKRIGLALVAGAVRVRDGPRHILNAGPIPVSAEIRLAVRKTRRRRFHVDFGFQRLADGRCE